MVNPRINDMIECEPDFVIMEDPWRIKRLVSLLYATSACVGGENPVNQYGDGHAWGYVATTLDIVHGEYLLGQSHSTSTGRPGRDWF